MEVLRGVLPQRYPPLLPTGDGLQSVYLAPVPDDLARVLFGLIGSETAEILRVLDTVEPVAADDLDLWEKRLERNVEGDNFLNQTERQAIVRARVGQGLFRERVQRIESRCRVTGVDNPEHLIASHCKPWRDASNEERLDGEDGLLLTPSVDHLFDRGFIGFEDAGRLIVSPSLTDHP